MNPLELVKLSVLMERTSGSPEVKIGLIDGPVLTRHADLASENIHGIDSHESAVICTQPGSPACLHGTFVTGILLAKRNSPAPAICPDCTLLIRPVFIEDSLGRERMPSTTPLNLAEAISECIKAGARIINLSLSLARSSTGGERFLDEVFNQALRRGVIIVAAAGNQGMLGSSVITRHQWVIPVAACDLRGRPLSDTNIGGSISRRGLSAPGEGVTSLGSEGQSLKLGGTSVAVPFVTGAIALLWSVFPAATAAQIMLSICQSTRRRASVVPPLLDAAAAYQLLLGANTGGRAA